MEASPTTFETEVTPSLAEDPALGLPIREKLEILFAVMLGLFLGALDQTIVGPALPTVVTQLQGNDTSATSRIALDPEAWRGFSSRLAHRGSGL